MRRREFITLLGGAALSWPCAARAQQGKRVRHIGVLLAAAANSKEYQARLGAFQQELQTFGWSIGRNLRTDIRWAEINADDIRRHAAELVALAPDVILAHGISTVGPLLRTTRSVPIVFPVAGDPVGAGLVDSLARPGGNATGFLSTEYSLSGKWLELLKEIAPGLTRVAVLRIPRILRESPSSASSRRWRRRSEWRSARSMCATPSRLSAPSPPSRALRMAV